MATLFRGNGRIQEGNGCFQKPLADICRCRGVISLSSSEGSFLLEGLPAGTHNLLRTASMANMVPFSKVLLGPQTQLHQPLAITPYTDVNIIFGLSVPEERH